MLPDSELVECLIGRGGGGSLSSSSTFVVLASGNEGNGSKGCDVEEASPEVNETRPFPMLELVAGLFKLVPPFG